MLPRHHISKIAALLAVLFTLPAVAVENAQQADSFVDSIGVNTHFTYPDTAYANTGTVTSLLLQLGVRHIRDGLDPSLTTAETGSYEAAFNTLASNSTNSVKCSLLLAPTNAVPVASALPNALESVEGPNETDGSTSTFTFPAGAASYQNALYNTLRTNAATATMPVIAPSLVNGSSFTALGLVNCTGGNMHSYPSGALPDTNLDTDCGVAPYVCGNSNPLYATETGYTTYDDGAQGISTTAQAKYMPRLFLEYFRRGIQRTYSYEFIDEWSPKNLAINNATAESHFGLLSVSTSGPTAAVTPKPAYYALQNLISLLGDKGTPFTPGSLDYTLFGTNQTALRHLLLQKRDGSFWLVLWQDVSDFAPKTYTDLTPSAQTATITFNQSVTSVTPYWPNTSTTPGTPYSSPTSTITVSVTDVPLILQITGVSPSTATTITSSVSMFGAAEGMISGVTPYANTPYFNVDYPDSRCGYSGTTTAFRSVTKYDLPPLPAGKTVGSVVYSFHTEASTGTLTPSMDIVSYESAQSNIRDIDWTDATALTDLGTVLTPSSTSGTYTLTGTISTALATAVRQAYTDGKSSIALRTQLTGGVFNSNSTGTFNDYYDIDTSKNPTFGYAPSFQLNLVNIFTDDLANGSNILINTPANLAVSYGASGMSLTTNAGSGSEWYWSQGGGAAWNNSNGLAFPIAPATGQNKLLITVESMSSTATLEVGAFFFNGTSLVTGTNQVLGGTYGTINLDITSPGTYEIDMNAVATAAGITGATGWKGDFWFSTTGSVGQNAVISTLSTSP